MSYRVWSLRPVRDAETGKWQVQAAVYEACERRDGMPIWKLVNVLGTPYPRNGDGNVAAARDGAASGLPKNLQARHGGLAIDLSQVFDDPVAESTWRLGGGYYQLAWARATSKGKKFVVALVRREQVDLVHLDGHVKTRSPGWVLVRRVATCTRKQLQEFQTLGLGLVGADSLPRLPGKEVSIR